MITWQYVIEGLKILVTLILGILVYRLTKKQVEIQANKNKHDKFDKRARVYGAYKDIIWAAAGTMPLTKEQREAFLKELWVAKFLFGSEVSEAIELVRQKASEFYMAQDSFEAQKSNLNRTQAGIDLRKMLELNKWFTEFAPHHQKDFLKYMDFREP